MEILKQGGKTKADLLLVDLGEGPLVVKDFGRKRWWVRFIGRLQISRECGAYEWLGPLPGVPRLFGRIDHYALAVERVEGRPLGYAPDRTQHGATVYPRLRGIVERLHAKGLVHWDLRARENVLIGPGGQVFVLDFASAIWLRPGGTAHRLLFRRMKLVDDSALLKWKRILEAGPYSPEEESFVRRHRFWRALWIFNPRRPKNRKNT